MKAVMPLEPLDLSVTAKVTTISAQSPLVMKVLPPLMMYPSPSLRAVVAMSTALEPAPLSVRAKAMTPPAVMASAAIWRCSSVPARRKGVKPNPVTREAKPTSPRASSSRMMAQVR